MAESAHHVAAQNAEGATAEAPHDRGERAGDWRLDELLLTALGFGEPAFWNEGAHVTGAGSAHERSDGDRMRSDEAPALAARDRDELARDPIVLYLSIHSNSIAHSVATMLQEHEEEWPAPSSELSWAAPARFTRRMVRTLCPVVRDDTFALFHLVHPLSPADAYRRQVDGVRAARTTWIPGFGEALAAQVKAAMFLSIERMGSRLHSAAAAGNGEPPSSAQIQTSHPLDTYVRSAMAEEGVLDYSMVSRSAARLQAPTRGGAQSYQRPEERPPFVSARAVTVQWLGKEDATLWNYVRVSPPGATAEEVAAALYGNPSQSRMAFGLQKHGDLFQVAPKHARELISSRYPTEVAGHGTARDGAALARSRIGDALALRETHTSLSEIAPDDADGVGAESTTLPQLLTLHFAILGELEKLRMDVSPLGLSTRLDPAFEFRARAVLEASHADAAERQQWSHVWRAQHVYLMIISAAVALLATQATATTSAPSPPVRPQTASLRARIAKYLSAATVSHLKESCEALLIELEGERLQERMDQATDAQISLRNAMRQANATPGQGAEPGSEEVDASLTSAQAAALRGEDSQRLQEAQLAAEEMSLRTRLQTARLALLDLAGAADEAGSGLSSELASRCSGRFRDLPALIDAVQLRLHGVERVWAATEREAPRPAAVADRHEEQLVERQARAKALDAANQAFAKIAGDQDIGTFLRESQQMVSSQLFRSGIVKLAGALVITVVTSGLAAQLGAGLAGLVSAGEAGGVLTAGAVAARAGGAAINLAVNVTVNSALQYAMSEGRDAMGWALVENALMELATRGLGQLLKAPMTQLRALEQQVMRDGQRLRQLAVIERDAARRGAALGDALAQERDVLRQAIANRAGWFVVDLTVEVVMGMASQWAARSLLHTMRSPNASVSDDFAGAVLQQGAAVMLGKRLFGLKAAWQARRAELEAQPWFTQLPAAQALVTRRATFFDDANALAQSLSPKLDAGPELLSRHEELVRLEQELEVQGRRPTGQRSHEGERDMEPPEAVFTPHVDRRIRMSSALPSQIATMQQTIGAPIVLDAAMVDGVRILARRVPRLIGFDLVVDSVHVGGEALTSDVLAHGRTIAAIEQYNGIVANLRELRQRLQRSAGRWFAGAQAGSDRVAADAALRGARGEGANGRPLEEQPFHFPRGSRGWATELELRKLHELLESRKSPLHEGAVDKAALDDEIAFLEGRRVFHEEVLRSIDDTALRAPSGSAFSLERPDTGEVTRDALAKGYRLPGAEETAQPEWYYYRNSAEHPGQYELARRPSSPIAAPGLRACVEGNTFTGFEPLADSGTEIPPSDAPHEVIKLLRTTSGFGEYLKMLESQNLAAGAEVDRVIQHELDVLRTSRKRTTAEALRRAVRDHFRERVTQRLCDPSLSDTASWQRLREMAATLSARERGSLAEIWYRHRHTKATKGQRLVEVVRTSGVDEDKIQRRVVDAVEGDTAIEVKDVTGPIDRDQFGAYMDMLKSPDDGSAPLFREVKYVFTRPEGAIANLEYMARTMDKRRFQGKLIIECFDRQGRKHAVVSANDAMRLLAEMEMR